MVEIDFADPAAALEVVLGWIEDGLDLDHLASVEDRHISALRWEAVDRPPVTFSAPVPEPFSAYSYHESFRDPTKMLVNELVGPYAAVGPGPSIVNSVLLKDDFPLQIRAFYGVGLVASLFGAVSEVQGNNFPWVRPIGPDALKHLVAHGVPEFNGGLFQRMLDTVAYYKEELAAYPKCQKAMHITQPDLQGPFDIAAQLCGGEIFTAFYDRPDFLRELLELMAETYVQVCRKASAASTESLRDDFIYLHFTICRGKCLLKDDSSTILSPRVYTEFIRPVNEKVLRAVGGGGIHWCGSGDHWRREFLDTEGLLGLDLGNPSMIDLPAWEQGLRERKIPVGNMSWGAEDFFADGPTSTFPTGASFTVRIESHDRAKRWLGK